MAEKVTKKWNSNTAKTGYNWLVMTLKWNSKCCLGGPYTLILNTTFATNNATDKECTALTLPMLRLLPSKGQGGKSFWKPCNSCHDGIHWIALTKYSQTSTHVPGFQSFFRFLHLIHKINHNVHQGLSQDLESGCLKLAVVKFWGVHIFKEDLQFTQISTINMYKFIKIMHDILM